MPEMESHASHRRSLTAISRKQRGWRHLAWGMQKGDGNL